MNEINRKVAHARRRLFLGSLMRNLLWCTLGALTVALIAMTVPKIWHLDFLNSANRSTWDWGWLGGSLGVGLMVALLRTWLGRQSELHAAIEIDRRFGLRERLSSALTLEASDAETEAGQALLEDAQRRAEGIDIGERFVFQPTRSALFPLAPILLIAGLLFLPDAQPEVADLESEQLDRKQVELNIKEFKKKVEERRKQLEAKGLKDASEDLKSIGKKFDKLLEPGLKDRKNTLVQLNDIKKEIEDKRKELGDSDQFRENLNRLKKISNGPAKKLSKAIGDGDLKKAGEEIKELLDKIKDGKLNEREMKQLAEGLKKMADELKQAAEKREREIQDLKNQIQKAVQQGDLNKAAQLQEKLEQKQQQNKQMEQMKKLAEKMQKCSDCMNQAQSGANGKPGQPGQSQNNAMQQAGESLEDMADQIREMSEQMDQMEALKDLEDFAEECKQGCQGMDGGPENRKKSKSDWGKGPGVGEGKRDIAEDDTGTFKARTRGDVKRGETVVTGNADGKNITGRSVTETRTLIQASMDSDVDPLENQKLTKKQREHAQQYFKAIREN